MTRFIRSLSLALAVGLLLAGQHSPSAKAQQPADDQSGPVLKDPSAEPTAELVDTPALENPSLAQLTGVQFLPLSSGLVVSSIDENSPLASSGLRAGDQLVLINGQRVETADIFYRWVPRARVGAASYFVVMRQDRPVTLTWTPSATITQRIPQAAPYLGVHIHPQIDDATVVTRVDRGSPAEQAGLRPDDIISALNERKIAGPGDFAVAVAELPPEAPVRFTFTRVSTAQAGGLTLPDGAMLPPAFAPAVRTPVPAQIQQPAYSPGVRPFRIPQQQFPRRAPILGRWR